MENKMAIITKRAYNAKHIGTAQFSVDCYDDKDSGLRLFYGDEDDHVLDRMECFRIVTLDEAVDILPELKNIIYNNDKHTYYHFNDDGSFYENDSFEAKDVPETDPFLNAFMKQDK